MKKDAKEKVILLIEDDAFIRNVVVYGLQAAGYRVHTAHNGEEAFRLLDELMPDLIILDLYMPKMDGLTFLKRYSQAAPVIVCSGSDQKADIAQTLEMGASMFLRKPINLTELQTVIEKFI